MYGEVGVLVGVEVGVGVGRRDMVGAEVAMAVEVFI